MKSEGEKKEAVEKERRGKKKRKFLRGEGKVFVEMIGFVDLCA